VSGAVARVWYISHPAVVVDPATPVPRWSLKPEGRAVMAAFADRPDLAGIRSIWSSDETKAIEAAAILGERLGLAATIVADSHENDRSATGFMPPPEFERAADAFFARPEDSFRGWERAVDAQARIAAAYGRILSAAPEGDVAIVGHGGVGTLLWCRLAGMDIDRRHDQTAQGSYWCAPRDGGRPLHGWRPLAG
jgi:broad specificity phosphatase PhoE